METTLSIILGILGISVLVLFYFFYQLVRNQKVYEIRIDWINEDDPRRHKYTYEYMITPSFRNWLGLKFPSKSDF